MWFACYCLLCLGLRSSECPKAAVSLLMTIQVFTALVLKPLEWPDKPTTLKTVTHLSRKTQSLHPRPSVLAAQQRHENVLKTTNYSPFHLVAFSSLAHSTNPTIVRSAYCSSVTDGETESLRPGQEMAWSGQRGKIFHIPQFFCSPSPVMMRILLMPKTLLGG